MAKNQKIKRYGSIYSGRREARRRFGKVLLWLVVFALLFLIGWGVYGPVSDWLRSLTNGPEPSSSAPSSSTPSPVVSTPGATS